MISNLSFVLTVAAMTLMPHAWAADPALNAEQGWSAVSQCAAISNERSRHDCVDQVLRRAGLLNPQVEAKERQRQFGLEDNAAARNAATSPKPVAAAPAAPPAPASTSAPVKPPSPVAAPTPAPAPAPEVDRLDVEVATAVVAADRKLVITTADGAVWKQIDSDTIPRTPRAGEKVSIRKGTLNSYLCSLPSRHTFRCQRTK